MASPEDSTVYNPLSGGGWAAAANADSRLHALLSAFGIDSEADYLLVRSCIDESDRDFIDTFRFRFLLDGHAGELSFSDPAQFSTAPRVLLDSPVSALELGARALHGVTAAQLGSVRDIVDLGSHRLLSFRYFGQKSLSEVIDRILILGRKVISGEVPSDSAPNPTGDVDPRKAESIGALRLGTRAANCLEAAKLRTIGDLLDFGVSRIIDLPNAGKRTVKEIVEALSDYMDGTHLESSTSRDSETSGPSQSDKNDILSLRFGLSAPAMSSSAPPRHVEKPNFGFDMRVSLDRLVPRERNILLLRLGMRGAISTLEEVATALDVTRERVRQIEAKARKKIESHEKWPSQMRAALDRIFATARSPVWLALLPALDPFFEHSGVSDLVLARSIQFFGAENFQCFQIDGMYLCSRILEEVFENLKKGFHDFVSGLVETRPSEFDLRVFAESFALNGGALDLHELLFHAVEPYLHLSQLPQGTDRVLVAFGRAVEHVVRAILEEAEEPLHYAEVHRRVIRRSGSDVEIRRVHNALSQPGIFLFGRGTFGLRRHLAASDEEISQIRQAAEDLVVAGDPHRQWHTEEIVAALPFEATLRRGEITSYTLNIMLAGTVRLRYLRRMVWVAESSAHRDSSDRIDIAQACSRFLREAGGPLRRTEILELLKDWRGIGKHFQLHGGGDIVAVAPGLWGLRGRDIPLTEPEIEHVLSALREYLFKGDVGVHLTEVLLACGRVDATVLDRLQPYWVLSLAGSDRRFRVFHGNYIGLASWETSRRLSVLAAARHVATEAQLPATADQLRDQLKGLTGRSITRVEATAALRDAGFVYQESLQLWSVANEEPASD